MRFQAESVPAFDRWIFQRRGLRQQSRQFETLLNSPSLQRSSIGHDPNGHLQLSTEQMSRNWDKVAASPGFGPHTPDSRGDLTTISDYYLSQGERLLSGHLSCDRHA